MINCISDMHEGCTLAEVKYSIIYYADDIALLAPSRIGLQKLLEILEQCVSDLGLVVNTDKSAYIAFMKDKSATFF